MQRSALMRRLRQCLVRGDIGTGKSALLKRLRGGGFTPSYEPRRVPPAPLARPPQRNPPVDTARSRSQRVSRAAACKSRRPRSRGSARQSPTTSSRWKCGTWWTGAPLGPLRTTFALSLTRGRSARKVATTGQLALGHRTRGEGDSRPEDGKHTLMPLDATVLDVYSGAHAVVFMVDPSKPWTVDYVTRELAKCPEHVRAHDSRILHARLLICSLAASGCCVGQLP